MSAPPFRLLALDIDGTLLTSQKHVSPRTQAAFRAARAAGCLVVLVTGRRHPSARRVAAELGDDSLPLILHNGALVIEDGVVLHCRPLAREVAHRAVSIGREMGADPVVHCGSGGEGRLLIDGVSPSNTLLAYYLDRSHPDVATVPDLTALAEDPLQVMFGGNLEAMSVLFARLRRDLRERARIERTVYPQNDVGLLDVLDPSVGKAPALAMLQSRFGIPAEETLAVGDNWNDREMLERAGLGLLMGNANPEMRSLGLPVLPTNDEDGLAVAIERHVLGTSAAGVTPLDKGKGGERSPPLSTSE